ncbi:MAG: DUF4442 domain-containing protein [Myxococcota bacterium]|jgi:acyl-coenzyme A thioesterase PaaI-like protein|nr:DUF4442 domain-containing protein [Myxococcota bacterium]
MIQSILGPLLDKVEDVSPSLVTELVRKAYGRIVPFARHSHIKMKVIEPGYAVAILPDKKELRNHIGSQHAAALYCLAESASGGAMIGVLGARVMKVRPVAATASIEYKKVARGPIEAVARTTQRPEEILETLDREGKVRFDVEVVLHDQKMREVCAVTVNWHVSSGSPS